MPTSIDINVCLAPTVISKSVIVDQEFRYLVYHRHLDSVNACLVEEFLTRGSMLSNRKQKLTKGGNLRQKPRKRQGTARRSVATIPHPPPIGDYAVTQSKRLRFTTNGAIGQEITFQNLLDCILISSTAILSYDLFNQVRIKKIRVWSMPAIGTSNTVIVIFNGSTLGTQGDRVVHTDASMGIEPAFLSVRPRETTLASMWQGSLANNAFYIETPTGAIVDVSLDYRSDTQGVPIAAQNAPAGAVIGALAFRGLDGLASAATKFLPPSGLYVI